MAETETLELPPPPAWVARTHFGDGTDPTPIMGTGPAGPGPDDDGHAYPDGVPDRVPACPRTRSVPERARARYAAEWARGPAGTKAVWARRTRWIEAPRTREQWALDSYKAAAQAGNAQFVTEHREAEAGIEAAVRARRVRARWLTAVPACLLLVFLVWLGWTRPLWLCLLVAGTVAAGPALFGLAGPPPYPGPGPDGGPGPDDPPEVKATLDKLSLTTAFTEAGVIKAGQQVEVWRIRPERTGWSCMVRFPGAITGKKAIAAKSGIAGSLGTDDLCLHLETVRGRNSDLFVLLSDEDQFATDPIPSIIPDLHEVDATAGVPYARTWRGGFVKAVFGRGSLLVAGESDSGKTLTARSILAGLALDPSVKFLIGDPQGLGGWAPFSAIGQVFTGLADDVVEALADALEEVSLNEYPRRQRLVEATRKADPLAVTESKITRAMTRDPKAGTPRIVIVLDEFHRYFATDQAKRIEDVIVALTSTGRAFAIELVGITQYPVDANVPARILALFQNRLAHACSTHEMANGALGYKTWLRDGINPMAIEATTHAGTHWAKGGMFEPRGTQLVRSDYNNDPAIARILAKAYDLRLARRPELLPIPPDETATVVTARGETLPEHLLEVLDLEHADQATSLILIAGLRRLDPARYGDVGDRGLNRLGADWGLRAHTLGAGPGRGRAGLTRREIEAAAPRRDGDATAVRDSDAT